MRRQNRYGVAVLALSLVVMVGAAAGAAGAAVTDPAVPVLVGASVDKPLIAVSGLNVVTETVSVHLTDPDGVCLDCSTPPEGRNFTTPAAIFSSGEIMELTLASGSATDGVWTGGFPITTLWAGHSTLTTVVVFGAPNSFGENIETDIVPADQGINVAFDVTATHASHISAGVVPNPAIVNASLTWKGRAYFPDTGAPIPNRTLVVGLETECGIDGFGNATVTTDSQGYWSYKEAHATDVIRCVLIIGTGGPGQFSAPLFNDRRVNVTFRVFRQTLSIVPPTTPVKVGTQVAITGHAGIPSGALVLERMVSGTWVQAGFSHIRPSGRYTVIAQPPAPGNWRYRVVAPAVTGASRAVSKIVIIGAY